MVVFSSAAISGLMEGPLPLSKPVIRASAYDTGICLPNCRLLSWVLWMPDGEAYWVVSRLSITHSYLKWQRVFYSLEGTQMTHTIVSWMVLSKISLHWTPPAQLWERRRFLSGAFSSFKIGHLWITHQVLVRHPTKTWNLRRQDIHRHALRRAPEAELSQRVKKIEYLRGRWYCFIVHWVKPTLMADHKEIVSAQFSESGIYNISIRATNSSTHSLTSSMLLRVL